MDGGGRGSGWLAGWLAGRLAGWLPGWLSGWLPGWLAGVAAGWPANIEACSSAGLAVLEIAGLLARLGSWRHQRARTNLNEIIMKLQVVCKNWSKGKCGICQRDVFVAT